MAVLDLITDYPSKGEAFIGWFMVDAALQGQGIGSQIFADTRASLSAQGFNYLELGILEANVDAAEFWKKAGFTPTGKVTENERYNIVVMGRKI